MSGALIITGASSGIGAACARAAAAAGYDALLACHSDIAGAEATAQAMGQHGRRAEIFQGDLTDPAEVERMFSTFDVSFQRLAGLINNAGIVDHTARVEDMSYARLTRMFTTNVIGPMLIAGQAVRRMSTRHGQDGGVIVNISSVAARLGSGNQYVDYAASKGAIDTFTKGLADEVAREGIRVVSVRPGLIETPIHGKGGLPNRAQDLSDGVPMGRPGSADEIAETVLWLMSDKASYITGTTIDVSGGR